MITISLMVLLAMLAVALLSLSSVAIRSSGNGNAMQEARANARLALDLAIGDLQKAMGPDQRVSAPGQFVDPNAPLGLTGVWQSHEPSPSEPSVTPSNRFYRWLVSASDTSTLTRGSAIPSTSASGVTLIGSSSLGGSNDPTKLFRAPKVTLTNDKNAVSGGIAYGVFDESTKARLNIEPERTGSSSSDAMAALGEARRFGMEAVSDFERSSIKWSDADGQAKISTLDSTLLRDRNLPIGELSHDVTVWSRGLLTDTARGGLRGDLSTLFEVALPTTASTGPSLNQTLYYDPSAPGTVARAAANPTWGVLSGFSTLYRSVVRDNTGDFKVNATLPRTFVPYRDRGGRITPNITTLNGTILMPVVSKVEMQFSVLTRRPHGGWPASIQTTTGSSDYKTMVHLIYSPVVTVYNPYNVPLEFPNLRIRFANVPIGFQFEVNGQNVTTGYTPLNQMYVSLEGNSNTKKEFFLKLVPQLSGSTSLSQSITLQPGESRVFGTPVPPNWSWAKDRPGDGNTMFDWRSDKTSQANPFELAAGWPGSGAGFDIDWLVPRPLKSPAAKMDGVLPLKESDQLNVRFLPLASDAAGNEFTATVDLDIGRGRYSPASVIQLTYNGTSGLTDLLTKRQQRDVTFPASLVAPVLPSQIFEEDTTEIKDYARAKPFAIFSFYNKTAIDGGSAARPGTVNPPTDLISVIDSRRDHPAIHSTEFAMLPIRNAGAGNTGAIEIDDRDRGYSTTGNTARSGIRAAPLYEIPLIPPQSIAQIRHANLAGSGHFPRFTYTAGESWAHPLIDGGQVVINGAKGYPYLDHSWLANSTLWDSWFYSTLCSYNGPAFVGNTARSRDQVVGDFLSGSRPLLNQRLSPRITGSIQSTTSNLAAGIEGARKAAAHLWVEGPFNVNSLSVEAWKSILASLNGSTLTVLDPLAVGSGMGVHTASSPLPRTRRSTGPPIGTGSNREQRWRGFRSLTDGEVDALAESIVEVTRERGPFLSLADFVNRDPQGNTDERLMGALQQAIEESNVNAVFSTQAINPDRDGREIPIGEVTGVGFPFPEAIAGPNYQGAPGYLTQGDILSAMGSIPTVHGDTFRIRAYGESIQNGRIAASAWCEAVVQRVPDFVDPSDTPETPVASLRPSNRNFGRRFELVSFRWLNPDEV
ncbi:MAG: hypothetical protein MUF31_07815 [Akkermansiaceae bacterium]|nr:hypothetical protein [Akkermansiaceae bacterium]